MTNAVENCKAQPMSAARKRETQVGKKPCNARVQDDQRNRKKHFQLAK